MGVKAAVLAVQGDFAEHAAMLKRLGVSCVLLRCREDLKADYDALILPGGESTVQGKLLRDLDMYDTLKEQIQAGLPVLATCAGLILLADRIEDASERHLGTLPVTVRRNAYGRQLGSFHMQQEVRGIGCVPMTFIRAPFVTRVSPQVEVLAEVDGHIVGVRYKKQTAYAFHPELDEDLKVYEAFLRDCCGAQAVPAASGDR